MPSRKQFDKAINMIAAANEDVLNDCADDAALKYGEAYDLLVNEGGLPLYYGAALDLYDLLEHVESYLDVSSDEFESAADQVADMADGVVSLLKSEKEQLVDESSEEEEEEEEEERNDLFLNAPRDPNASYLIAMAPINSSGDIYHILPILMLDTSLDRTPLRVLLTSANDEHEAGTVNSSNINTADQVKRSIDFAASFGLQNYFDAVQLSPTSYRENSRQAELHKYLQQQTKSVYYLDQMGTTVLLAQYFDQYGRIEACRRLRQGFSKRSEKGFPVAMQEKVDSYVTDIMDELEKRSKHAKRELVIMHLRYSRKANECLDLPANFIKKLAEGVSQEGFQILFLLVDSRTKNRPDFCGDSQTRFYHSSYQVSPFSEKQFFDKETGIDYSKRAHLQLLLALQEKPGCRVIGNTSGTLDIAAFIGLHVYNIHQFSGRFSYQECRLFFQLCIMSCGAFIANQGLSSESGFDEWMDKPRPLIGASVFRSRPGFSQVESKKDQAGYCKLFNIKVFNPVAGNDPRTEEIPGAVELFRSIGC